MTSILGHMLNLEFPKNYKNWQAINPIELFTAPLEKCLISDDKQPLLEQLQAEAKQADTLLLWLDCDREGENISVEVEEICLAANKNLIVKRAHFSALTYVDVTRAIQNLGNINRNLSEAVMCRQEIDLRLGAAFTRFQTMLYRKQCKDIFTNKCVVS